ncbi:nSTAND1 domain-containing NTPase [Paractinoplanes brasiliensis]|uniref:WD40 repeat protein n=1 Tax=Paractinoplanes brasiliensis TaxID=52695 RepID=A0A4R6J7R9_9ACTN|nr:caspase family protein [Actinoplanes brasiliensis]TDO31570.1 WD40 repeat protein [Actinoplanes brasiliensis]GID30969.1 hypothetical protein Abr02nite_59520 [Actinoplanes brasiliensis]
MADLTGSGVRVLVVGAATYRGGSPLLDVPAAARSARAVADALVGYCGVDADSVEVLIDPAGPMQLLKATVAAAREAGETFVLWYSGHGLLNPDGELHLATQTTVRGDDPLLPFTALDYHQLALALGETGVGTSIVVLDCCFSGRAKPPTLRSAVLASAERDAFALAEPGAELTSFAGAFLRVLREGDEQGPRRLTLHYVRELLARRMIAQDRPVPQFQTTNQVGDVVVTINRAYAEPVVDEPPAGPATPDDGRSPYRGLDAYLEEDASVFHGRATVTQRLVERVRRASWSGGICVVIGPSGSGKSSVLHAGMLAKLRAGALPGSEHWPSVSMTPGRDPFGTLAGRLAELTGLALPGVREKMLQDPARFLARIPPRGARPVLVIDQFEEIFTLVEDEEERRSFVELLAVAAAGTRYGPAAIVVLGVRSDFHGHCTALPALAAALTDGHVVVGPMSRDELRAAIVEPATVKGLRLEDGLVELLVRDAGTGALPYLSYALLRTWQLRENRVLKASSYAAVGGVAGAIEQAAERTYQRLDEPGRRAARRLLLQLVSVGADARADTGAIVDRSALPASHTPALEAFVRARLVNADGPEVRIAHEALIGSWDRLAGWLHEDRDAARQRQELASAVAAWQTEPGDPALLLRGSRLEQATTWAKAHDEMVDENARSFLDASQRLARRTVARRRAGIGLLAALTLLASGAAVTAGTQRAEALRQRDNAVTNEIIAQADRLRATDAALAAQLDVVSYRRRPTVAARSKLLNDQNLLLARPLAGHTRTVWSSAWRPDGGLLATASGDGTVRLWDTRDPDRPAPLGEPLRHDDEVRSVAFSPSGRMLASSGIDGSVRLWDVDSRTAVRWTAHRGAAWSVAFRPDGQAVATGGADGRLRLWSTTGKPLGPALVNGASAVEVVAFQPDGKALATADRDGRIRLWDMTRGVPSAELPRGHTAEISAMSFHPGGRVLATTAFDGTLRLWDVRARKSVGAPLEGSDTGFGSVSFGGGGRVLVAGDLDGTVRLWDTADPGAPRALTTQTLSGRSGAWTAAVSPDGRSFVTAGDDGRVYQWRFPPTMLDGVAGSFGQLLHVVEGDSTVREWDLRDPAAPRPGEGFGSGLTGGVWAMAEAAGLLAAGDTNGRVAVFDARTRRRLALVHRAGTRQVHSVALRADGKLLAVADLDGSVRLWNLHTPARPALLPSSLPPALTNVAFSPSGALLAAGDSDRVVLWDVTEPARPVQVGPPLTAQASGYLRVAFSPDGRLLATTSFDKTVRLWDVSDPRRPVARGLPAGHSAGVTAAAFSPDGRVLATGGADKTVRVWDISDPGAPEAVGEAFTGHVGPVTGVLFTADASAVVSTGGTGSRVWPLDPARAIDRICRTTRGVLTEDVWRASFPDVPFATPC